MKRVFKDLILFVIFGAIYFGLECIWKGAATHWTMFAIGGFIGVLIGGINEYIPLEMPFFLQCGIGTVIATVIEGISGLILNIYLNLHIWDYSNVPFNFFYQQCCLPFCAAWFILSGACIIVDDYIRYKIFNEEHPHYIL